MKNRKNINLILSGGSARGLAHIGVISVLEKYFNIKSIIATSMGAVIGGLYCAGVSLDEMKEISKSLNTVKMLSLFPLGFSANGLTDGSGALKLFEELTKEKLIEDCKTSFAAIAFDLISKKTVVIDKGSVAKAVRASSSIPFVFKPYIYGKYLFVDGFIEHPLPIEFANYFYKDIITVASSVLPIVPASYETFQQVENEVGDIEMPRMLDVFFQTNLYSQSLAAIDAISKCEPDIFISSYNPKLKIWEFDEVEELYELGRYSTQKAVDNYLS